MLVSKRLEQGMRFCAYGGALLVQLSPSGEPLPALPERRMETPAFWKNCGIQLHRIRQW